jgi:hypothetical protein
MRAGINALTISVFGTALIVGAIFIPQHWVGFVGMAVMLLNVAVYCQFGETL